MHAKLQAQALVNWISGKKYSWIRHGSLMKITTQGMKAVFNRDIPALISVYFTQLGSNQSKVFTNTQDHFLAHTFFFFQQKLYTLFATKIRIWPSQKCQICLDVAGTIQENFGGVVFYVY